MADRRRTIETALNGNFRESVAWKTPENCGVRPFLMRPKHGKGPPAWLVLQPRHNFGFTDRLSINRERSNFSEHSVEQLKAWENECGSKLPVFVGLVGAVDPDPTHAEPDRACHVPAIRGLERDRRRIKPPMQGDEFVNRRGGLVLPAFIDRNHVVQQN